MDIIKGERYVCMSYNRVWEKCLLYGILLKTFDMMNETASRSMVCCFFVCKACKCRCFLLFGYRSPLIKKPHNFTCISVQSLCGNDYHNYNNCIFLSCHMLMVEFVWFPHIRTKLLQFPRPSFSKYRRGCTRQTILRLSKINGKHS